MFNNPFKQFNKDSKQVKLTEQEKSQVRERLLSYISSNPVSSDLALRHRGLWSKLVNYNLYNNKLMPTLLTIVLATSVVTGVALASQNALPGDTLYPVKIKSEEVRSALTFSAQSKAKLETELAQERLQEAEELSGEARLDDDVRTQIEDNFEAHANRVEERISEFSSKDSGAAASISANFETSLRAHDRILTKLAQDKDGKTAPQIGKLLIKVRAEATNANDRSKFFIQSIKNSRLNIKSDTNIESNTEVQDKDESPSTSTEVRGGLKVRLGL